MMGHTDKATINERRPLTPGMRALLKQMVRNGTVDDSICSNGEKNQLRGLMDRGYALPRSVPRSVQMWEATDAGRAALDL